MQRTTWNLASTEGVVEWYGAGWQTCRDHRIRAPSPHVSIFGKPPFKLSTVLSPSPGLTFPRVLPAPSPFELSRSMEEQSGEMRRGSRRLASKTTDSDPGLRPQPTTPPHFAFPISHLDFVHSKGAPTPLLGALRRAVPWWPVLFQARSAGGPSGGVVAGSLNKRISLKTAIEL
jgi:hypothetical protein